MRLTEKIRALCCMIPGKTPNRENSNEENHYQEYETNHIQSSSCSWLRFLLTGKRPSKEDCDEPENHYQEYEATHVQRNCSKTNFFDFKVKFSSIKRQMAAYAERKSQLRKYYKLSIFGMLLAVGFLTWSLLYIEESNMRHRTFLNRPGRILFYRL